MLLSSTLLRVDMDARQREQCKGWGHRGMPGGAPLAAGPQTIGERPSPRPELIGIFSCSSLASAKQIPAELGAVHRRCTQGILQPLAWHPAGCLQLLEQSEGSAPPLARYPKGEGERKNGRVPLKGS